MLASFSLFCAASILSSLYRTTAIKQQKHTHKQANVLDLCTLAAFVCFHVIRLSFIAFRLFTLLLSFFSLLCSPSFLSADPSHPIYTSFCSKDTPSLSHFNISVPFGDQSCSYNMKKASNWAAKWFTSPSPPFSPSDDPQTPRSVHSTFSKTSQPYRLLNSSKPKPLFTYQVTNDSTLSIDTNNTSVHNHPYGAFAGVTAATASTSCTSLDTTPSLDDNNSHMFGYGHNNDVRKERSFLKSWKRHYPQGRLAQASASAPDIRLGDERSLTLSSFPEPPGPFSPTLRRHPPGGSGSSVSSGRSNLRNMFLSRDPAPDTVPSRAVFSSSSSSVCSVSSTSLTVIRYPPEPTTSTRRPFADKPEGTKEQGWSERLSLQSKRLRSSILSNGSTKKAIPPSLLGSRIHKHNHSTSSLPPTMPDTPTSVAAAISHLSPSPKPKVATETRITAAVALQTKNTSHPPESAAKMGEKITKASPPPLQASVSPPPQILGHDNLSLTYGLMLQSLPEDEEQLNAQVSNLFGIAMHFAHKIQRLEKELQELQTRKFFHLYNKLGTRTRA